MFILIQLYCLSGKEKASFLPDDAKVLQPENNDQIYRMPFEEKNAK
jgi:hypothetical protein